LQLQRQNLEKAGRRLADFARARVLDLDSCVHLKALSAGACLGASDDDLEGRSVLLSTRSQLLSAAALVELDGLAKRIILVPPALPAGHVRNVITDAEVDCVVTDDPQPTRGIARSSILSIALPIVPRTSPRRRTFDTEWILLTSGTSGRPKMVIHSLDSLTGAIPRKSDLEPQVWSTFYDIRRYGGLQIFLRALLGGADLVLTSLEEPLEQQLARLGAAGVTSISGTPSHWRRVLMSENRGAFAPSYIRLSGEIADQGVLNALRATFPDAKIGHAYASTEAGVGFAVNDCVAGFPSILIDKATDGVEMRVVDGALLIKSSRTARQYVEPAAPPLLDSNGFVNSGDLVERRHERYYFVGRRDGIINVGGLKVNPEEVEAVLNEHAAVRISRVRGRKNRVTGAIVIADIVPCAPSIDEGALTRELLAHCQQRLERHKTPAIISFVSKMGLSTAGKLKREAAQE
jgi:acyl-coenzyme A synthetase/AMP-(fatty) acid ligase